LSSTDRINAMGTRNMLPLIVSMAIPAVCANVVSALYTFIDRFYVGHFVGRDALGSIGLVFPVTNLTSALTIMLSIGGSALLSGALGEKNMDKANKAFTNICAMSVLLAILISIAFFLFAEPLVILCGGTRSSALYGMAVTYLRITSIGRFFMIVNLALAAAIRSEGNTKYAMFVTMAGALINTVVDPLLIAVLHMNLAGAATSTVISQFLSCLLSVQYFVRGKGVFRWTGRAAMDARVMLRVAALGAAPAVFQALSFFNNTLINHSLVVYGDAALGAGGGDLALSAVSVISSVESFAIMFVMGLNNALSVIISYNYGHRLFDRVKQATLTGQLIATASCVVVWAMMMFFPRQLFLFFSVDTALADYGVRALHLGKLFIFGLGTQTLASMYYSAIGQPKRALLISLSRNGLFLIPSLLILPPLIGLDGVLCSSSISDGCSLILVLLMYGYGIRELKQKPALQNPIME